MSNITRDIQFRVIFIGDSGVGKTSLINRYVVGRMEKYKCGLGADFDTKSIQLEEKYIRLCIWDTFGQERFNSLSNSYYRGADGVVVVYSVNKQQSFDHVPGWLEDVAQYCGDDVNKVLVANKCDLASDRDVEYTAGQKYADSLGMPFLETSAKENTNVDAAFTTLAREILDRKRPEVEAEILLNASKQPKPGGCCYSSV